MTRLLLSLSVACCLSLLPLVAQQDSLPRFLRPDTTQVLPRKSLKVTGNASLHVGGLSVLDLNPTRLRSRKEQHIFDFRHTASLRVEGEYGKHLGFQAQYNSYASSVSEQRQLTLRYTGREYDLVQGIEAGDFSFVSRNPLITPMPHLFGLSTHLNVAGWEVRAFASSQEARQRRILLRGGEQEQPFSLKASQYDAHRHYFLSEYFAQLYETALKGLPTLRSELYIERIEVWTMSPSRTGEQPELLEKVGVLTSAAFSESPPHTSRSATPDFQLSGARRLSPELFHLNRELGYLSLSVPLEQDEVLVVSYEYTYQGKRYKVGAFSAQEAGGETPLAILLAPRDKAPSSPHWGLMMKNAYALPRTATLTPSSLQVELRYRDLQAGLEHLTLTEGPLAGQAWSTLLGWDRVDSAGESQPDGRFDFVSGATIDEELSVLFLPWRRPWDSAIPTPYRPYPELYDHAVEEQAKYSELDRFVLRGSYRHSARRTLSLGTMAPRQGAVVVRQQGRILQEGTDYTIDYLTHELTLLLPLAPDDTIEVIIDDSESAQRQQNKLLGVEAHYAFSPFLSMGATLLTYREEGENRRPRLGEEHLHNRLWGTHLSYTRPLHTLRYWLDERLPQPLAQPPLFSFQAGYARLQAVAAAEQETVVEDFELSTQAISLLDPSVWRLASPPSHWQEAVDHRALFSLYQIDRRLLHSNPLQPPSLKGYRSSSVWEAEVPYTALFTGQQRALWEQDLLPIVNLSFYPSQRGPYNVATEGVDRTGRFLAPERMWGGAMRSLPVQDFEAGRIAFIEGWFMQPSGGGVCYIDIGRLSEELLPDGQTSYEGGLPTPRHPDRPLSTTSYATVPIVPAVTNLFDRSSPDAILYQDIGLDGLSSRDELLFPRYSAFLQRLRTIVAPEVWEQQCLDPATDDYTSYWHDPPVAQTSIPPLLRRYQRYLGLEGNSSPQLHQGELLARSWLPDIEDLDGDLQTERDEAFFRYRLSLHPHDLRVGRNHIVGEKEVELTLPDGSSTTVKWYKVRIPITAYSQRVGSSPSFKEMRALRLLLTECSGDTHLRWSHLQLVRSDWRLWELPLDSHDDRSSRASLGIVSIEEDASRLPVPYLLPPGLERKQYHDGLSSVGANERALSLTIDHLAPQQSIALYREFAEDLSRHDLLKMSVHAEAPADDPSLLQDGQWELFVRLGRDLTDNYYEYTQPLTFTPHYGQEPLSFSPEQVWPSANEVEVPLSLLSQLHLPMRSSGVPLRQPLPGRDGHSISIVGYPSLRELAYLLVGVRSRAAEFTRGEVWIDEVRTHGRRHSGGDAYTLTAALQLQPLGGVSLERLHTSAGFGQVHQHPSLLLDHDTDLFKLGGSLNVGLLLPEAWQVSLPFTYSFSSTRLTPLFDPYHTDLLYRDKLASLSATERSAYRARTLHAEQALLFTLHDAHPFGRDSLPRLLSLANLRAAYSLDHRNGSSPALQHSLRHSSTARLSYQYHDPQHSSSLLPELLTLTSLWHRLFDSEHPYGGDVATLAVHRRLFHRFDWDRSLQLQWRFSPEVRLLVDSQTSALLAEPFSSTHAFELLPRETLSSLASWGDPTRYSGRTTLQLSTPKWSSRLLVPFSAHLTWRNHYLWERGLSPTPQGTPHTVRQNGDLELRTDYSLPQLRLPRLSFRLHETWGSHLPGFVTSVAPLLGLTPTAEGLALPLAYVWGVGQREGQLRQLVKRGLILTREGESRPLTWWRQRRWDLLLEVRPLPGFTLALRWRREEQHHRELSPLSMDEPPFESGSYLYSTLGLRSFWSSPLALPGYVTPAFSRYQERVSVRAEELRRRYPSIYRESVASTHPDVLVLAFADAYTHTWGRVGESLLPTLSLLMPSWQLRYTLPSSLSWLRQFTFTHDYHGTLEVNRYEVPSKWRSIEGGELGYLPSADGSVFPIGRHSPLTLIQRDLFAPLIGVESTWSDNLQFSLHYNRSRDLSLLLRSARMVETHTHDLSSSLSLRYTLPTLVQLLRGGAVTDKSAGRLALHASGSFARNTVVTRDLQRYLSYASQGIESFLAKVAIDYSITRFLTLRGFYQHTQRTPIVSAYSYPYREISYGLQLHLHLF